MKPNFGIDLEVLAEFDRGSGLGGSSSVAVSVIGALNHFRNENHLDTFNIDLDKFNTYDGVQIIFKDKDKNYIIHSITGIQQIDIEKCYSQFNYKSTKNPKSRVWILTRA